MAIIDIKHVKKPQSSTFCSMYPISKETLHEGEGSPAMTDLLGGGRAENASRLTLRNIGMTRPALRLEGL